MKTVYKGFASQADSPVAEARAAIGLAPLSPGEVPTLIGFTPVGRTNPYQALLYKSVAEFGVVTAPVVESWNFHQLGRVAHLTDSTILHIHWTSFVLNKINTYSEARARISDLKNDIGALKARGVRLIWTLHNIIPHDSQYPDLEIMVQQFLADEADVLHALSYSSLDVMEQIIAFDRSKVIVVPHPNYRYAYEDYISRADARLAFGLGADERVYVLLGALKRYKGLPVLLEAFERLCAEDTNVRRKLLVGGMPDDDGEVQRFVTACERSPNVLIEAKKIPSSFVQYYMRAADVGLAAYSRMLNSGALLLYQTFDLPVVTSSTPALWEHMTGEIAEPVDSPDVQGMLDGLRRAERFFNTNMRPKVRAYVDQFEPEALSRSFVSQTLSRLNS